jgi:hypothetical protein
MTYLHFTNRQIFLLAGIVYKDSNHNAAIIKPNCQKVLLVTNVRSCSVVSTTQRRGGRGNVVTRATSFLFKSLISMRFA